MSTRSPTWLLHHKRNVYSQTGEDGVIEAILATLDVRDRWCVEFGAWDGQFLSNSRNLIENAGYRSVLIEADQTRWRALKDAYAQNSNVSVINARVGFDAASGLDAILAQTLVPKDFDFCSIDIDGNDYHAWKAVTVYCPKLVCIEFNPTIPTDCPFVQPADPNINQGSGLLALVDLAKSKGYELASVLPFNAFFIHRDLFARLDIADNRPVTLRTDLSLITYLFQGFDGTIFLHGSKHLVWHGLPIDERDLQVLPKYLRRYPENYTGLQARLFAEYRDWRRRRSRR